MSLRELRDGRRELRDGRALMLRLVLAEVLAKRGEGPLARRLSACAKTPASSASPALAGRAERVEARGSGREQDGEDEERK